MKLAMIAFLAKYLSERQKLITSFKKGLVPSLGLAFVAFSMIMLQPDLRYRNGYDGNLCRNDIYCRCTG